MRKNPTRGKVEEEKDYNSNKYTKKIFSYIVREEKYKYIWNYAVPMRGILIVGGVGLVVGLIFGDIFHYPSYFWINTFIKLILSIPISAVSGKLTYEVFKDIRNRGCWTKATVWKYVIGDGIFGYGLMCFLILGQFIPLNIFYILVQLILWMAIGMVIGIWTRISWRIDKIKSILLELKSEGIY